MTFRSLLLAVAIAVIPFSSSFASETAVEAERARILGDYLSGSYARYLNDPKAQSQFFRDAFTLAPTDNRLGRLAVSSALFSGDQKLARDTAQRLYRQDKTESMSRAVLSVDAFAKGRSALVRKYATDPTADITMSLAMKIVLGWTLVDEGKNDAARKIFADMVGASYFETLGQLQLAKLEGRLGNVDAANAAFDVVESRGAPSLEYVLARARFETANKMRDQAEARLQAQIAENSAADIGPVGDYLNRLRLGKRLPKLSVRAEASRALTDPSFAFFVRNNSVEGAETYLRFARWIDPDFDRAAIWLAGLLEETHPVMNDATRAEIVSLYRSVEEASPYFVSARLGEANQLFDQELDEAALQILESLSGSHPSYFTREALGRARFFRENWEEALPFYTHLVESLLEEALRTNPEPLRLRGIIYERLGMWPDAEADFLRVLDYQPDDVDTLNYLGYTWVNRGENLTRGFELIERAIELEPDSGAITDSLGWAHYKLGQYEDAKKYLEKAVVLTPYSATIVDHLGDAYWKLGRKREAIYQWQRALEYDATDEEIIAIQTKLDSRSDAIPAQ